MNSVISARTRGILFTRDVAIVNSGPPMTTVRAYTVTSNPAVASVTFIS